MPEAPISSVKAVPSFVIDTQTVMDWLVFKDAKVLPLARAVDTGSIRWIGHPDLLDELRHVIGRGVAASFSPDLSLIEQVFAEKCRMVHYLPTPSVRLKCRDSDDQKFIDLALAEKVDWLISRDKAVLALAKRARAFGLEIGTVATWLQKQP